MGVPVPANAPAFPNSPLDGRLTDTFVHLDAAGVSVLLDATAGRLPSVVHWGASLGSQGPADVAALSDAAVEPQSGNVIDEAVRLAILPEHHAGWQGKPGVAGHRDGADWSPKFAVTSIAVVSTVDGVPVRTDGLLVEAGPAIVTVDAHDPIAGLAIVIEIELLASGLLRARSRSRERRR
jgi:alpha-galactosidase